MIRTTHSSALPARVTVALLALALVAGLAPRVEAQSYERVRATKLVLSSTIGGTPDLSHTITISAPSLSINSLVTWPAANAPGILTNDGLGNLSWVTLGTTSITPGTNNTFLVTDGTGAVNWDAFSRDATLVGDGITTPLGINLANPNTWTGAQTIAPTTNVAGLVVQGTSAGTPTADMFDVQNAGGSSTYFNVDKTGLVNVGTGTSLNGALNVNGYITYQYDFVTVPGSATSDDVNPGNQSLAGILQNGTAGDFTITGFTNGTDGRLMDIVNLTSYNLTLANQRGSAVANQIQTANGQDLVLPPYAVVRLIWSDFFGGWAVEYTSGINSVALGNTGLTTMTQNGILYGNGTNPIGVTSPAANSVLVTDGSDNPSLSQTLPAAVQANITSLTGLTGDIQYPTSLTFDGTADRVETLERNTGTNPGSGLTIQAGAPQASASVNNLNGGDLTLSSGISEGSGLSSILFQTPAIGSTGNSDNTPATRMTLNSTQLELASGMELDQNGTQRISSTGAGTLTSLTLGTPLTGANGGTGSSYVSFTTGGSTARTYTLPDANATLLSTTTGVELQSSTPGTAQSGNVNLAGTLLATTVGIGTSSPTGGLDIEGTLVYGIDSVTIAGSSSNNNVSPGLKSATSIGMSGTLGPATITGFSGGVAGRTVRIGNATGQNITLSYMSSLSSPGNQIYNATGQDFVLLPKAVVEFTYVPGLHAWGMGYVEGVPTPIALGGTGATTAPAALANLLPASPTTGYFLEWNGSAFVWNSVSASPGVVTSVGIDPGSTGLTVSNSPITSSGNIGIAGTLNIANGGTGQTTANAALNALLPSQSSKTGQALLTDGTNSYWSSVGTGNGTVTSVNVAIPGMTSSGAITTSGTISMSGDLAVSNGGTGQGSALTQGGVVYGASTTAMAASTGGTSGQVLVSGGTGAPSFTSSLSGLTIDNSTIGLTTPLAGAFTSATTPNIYGGSMAGSELNLQSTSNVSPAGDYITLNAGGVEQARITSTGLGVGTTSPAGTLDDNGTFLLHDDTVTITGGATNNNVSSGVRAILHVGLQGTAAPSTITGFAGVVEGRQLEVINLTGQPLTLANRTGSLVANQIYTETGNNITLAPDAVAQLRHDDELNGWYVEFINGGAGVTSGGTGEQFPYPKWNFVWQWHEPYRRDFRRG